MTKPKTRIFPSLLLSNPPPFHLLILSRSRTLSETYRAEQNFPSSETKTHYFYSPEAFLHAWRDRQVDCQVVVLETPTDSPFFSEEVGRLRLFFRAFAIIQLEH